MKVQFILIFLFGIFTSCTSNPTQKNDEQSEIIAFTHVNVIPMDENIILPDQNVLISEGKIIKVGDASSIEIPEGATIINGENKYLMPGLTEMHSHIPSSNQDNEILENTLFLYLANGITTIRGMLGEPSHLELRAKAANGEILAPRIFTSGPSLNGNTVTTVEGAQQKVKEQKEAGYDFLKLHPGLKLEVFNEIVKTAHEVDIPFSGHVSVMVGVRRALDAPYASIDHLDGYLEGLIPESSNLAPDQNGFFGFNFVPYADLSMISQLASETQISGVWVVPTHALMQRWTGPTVPEVLVAEPEMKYMPKKTLQAWVDSKKSFQSDPAYSIENAIAFIAIRDRILKGLYEANVRILLGSDSPQVFNVPGFSIHHELKAMTDAGISNYDALRSGTINPAIFFRKMDEFGVVKSGASADLILLNKNPLDDIAALIDRSGVMVKGHWISKKEIEEKLSQIATQNGY